MHLGDRDYSLSWFGEKPNLATGACILATFKMATGKWETHEQEAERLPKLLAFKNLSMKSCGSPDDDSGKTIQSASGSRQEIKCPGCLSFRVLSSRMVRVTEKDDNGYTHAVSGSLERLRVVIERSGQFKGDYANGNTNDVNSLQLYSKGNQLDLLCWASNDGHGNTTPACPNLTIGTVHDSPVMVDYIFPYLLQQFSDGSKVGWQILEVCHQGSCREMSSIRNR